MGKIDEIAQLAVRLGGEAPPPKYIRAYHGSPHSFDSFDASKIGTGEGAQAYGHGMYFAGSEDVAKAYRDALQHRHVVTPQGERILMPEWITDDKLAQDGVQYYLDRVNQLIAGRQEFRQPLTDLPDDLRALEALAGGGAIQRSGHMYEVDLGHPEASLLDWDAPIRMQPEGVQAAVRRALGDGGGDLPGRHAYEELARNMNSARAASDVLNARGVPGLRYLDQGSRAAGEGTRNYVMFPGTENQIRILRKYAVPGAIGAGAAGAMQDRQ